MLIHSLGLKGRFRKSFYFFLSRLFPAWLWDSFILWGLPAVRHKTSAAFLMKSQKGGMKPMSPCLLTHLGCSINTPCPVSPQGQPHGTDAAGIGASWL